MSTIEQLNIDIQANVQKTQATNIDKLATSLQKLKTSLSGLNGLASIVTQLNTLSSTKGLSTTSNAITKLTTSLNSLKTISLAGLSNNVKILVKSLSPLSKLQFNNLKDISGIANFAKGISSFANGIEKLNKVDISKLATDMQAMATALTPLTNEFLRGGTSAQAYAIALKSISSAKLQAVTNTKALTPQVKSLTSAFAKFTTVAYAIRRITSLMASSIQQSANYTENLNLFAVTYGETYKETLQWTTDIAERFGFATNELVKATGLFMQLSTAIGVANDTGELMSKTLTQLALDFTSFYNVASLDTTIQKLQAGIFSGQTKPLRALGIDVTYQTLDFFLETNEAMAQFNVSSKQLTQSQKAIARLIVTMNAGQNAFGDMSNTIDTTANALRVLDGSWQNLQLAVGDAFLTQPFTDLIILAGGVVQGITAIIRAFVPLREELDYSVENNFIDGVNTELEEMQENLGLLSFDKFEVLGGQESGLAEDLSITNALTAELERQAELYDEIFMSTSGVASKAVEIGETIRDWFINVDVEGNFESLSDNFKTLLSVVTALIGLKLVSWVSSGVLAFNKYIVEIMKATGATKALTIASKLLQTAGIFLLIYSITQLVLGWEEMNSWQKFVYISLTALGVALIVFSNITLLKTTLGAISKFITSLVTTNTSLLTVNKTLSLTKMATLGLGVAIGGIVGSWLTELPSGIRLIAGALFFLVGAAIAAAIAVGALQSAWSLGLAAVGIVAGIIAITSAINEAADTGSLQYHADGGTFDLRGGTAVGVVNEYGRDELVYSNNARQIEVANQQSLEENFFNALIRYHSLTADEKQQLTIEIRDKTQSGFVQFISPKIITEAKRVGIL